MPTPSNLPSKQKPHRLFSPVSPTPPSVPPGTALLLPAWRRTDGGKEARGKCRKVGKENSDREAALQVDRGQKQ